MGTCMGRNEGDFRSLLADVDADPTVRWEWLAGDPETGRECWMVRKIPTGVYGDPREWSIIVLKKSHGFHEVELLGAENLKTVAGYRDLAASLLQHGFDSAYALRKGRKKYYKFFSQRT